MKYLLESREYRSQLVKCLRIREELEVKEGLYIKEIVFTSNSMFGQQTESLACQSRVFPYSSTYL